jgi:hypothetical protein
MPAPPRMDKSKAAHQLGFFPREGGALRKEEVDGVRWGEEEAWVGLQDRNAPGGIPERLRVRPSAAKALHSGGLAPDIEVGEREADRPGRGCCGRAPVAPAGRRRLPLGLAPAADGPRPGKCPGATRPGAGRTKPPPRLQAFPRRERGGRTGTTILSSRSNSYSPRSPEWTDPPGTFFRPRRAPSRFSSRRTIQRRVELCRDGSRVTSGDLPNLPDASP